MRSFAGLTSIYIVHQLISCHTAGLVLHQCYPDTIVLHCKTKKQLPHPFDSNAACIVKTYSPHDLQASSVIRSGYGDFCPMIIVKAIFLCMLIRVVCGGMSCFATKPLTACPLSLVKW